MSMFRRRLLMRQAQYMSLPEPIAKYEAYNLTNDSDGRETLTDLTGNGHDIQLYNFAFDGASGYGKYSIDMNSIVYRESDKSYRLNYNTFNLKGINFSNIKVPVLNKQINVTINVNIKNEYTENSLDVYYFKEDNNTAVFIKYGLANGINTINYTMPEEDNPVNFVIAWRDRTTNVDVDIEFIPDYKGALVSDGVDDYGLCENFPILTKEKGYTVCAIRTQLNNDGTLVSKRTVRSSEGSGDQIGAFQVERYYGDVPIAFSFGGRTNFDSHSKDIFIFQRSNSYCGIPLLVGECKDYVDLTIFGYYRNLEVGSFALYALEIYDRDLTDEEIAKVKERMIQRYEEKTGQKYEEA